MDGVQGFLERLELSEHLEMFMAKGFDTEDDLPYLLAEDLDAMYITDLKARQKILQAAPHYRPSKEYLLYDWLRGKGLDHYFVSFIQSELVDLVDIAKLNLPNDQLYDELEITLPGHKRRLERAVRSLAKKYKTQVPSFVKSTGKDAVPIAAVDSELPVAYGRWGKPRCLVDAKYDFLILDATVVSTKDPRDRVHIEFMVDSGSDVVTLRQEVLDTMDLALIGPINSKGVHGSKVKNLYRANILIGNQIVEIEVMGESYDSIGSRVIRHFRHYISGASHIWLKGDYIDPTLPHKTNIPEREAIEVTTHPIQETVTTPDLKDPAKTTEQASSAEKQIAEVSGILDEREEIASGEVEEETEETIQTDFVKVDTHSRNRVQEDIDSENVETNINFQFSKTETETNGSDNGKSDETDRIRCEDDEIIDIRPIIAANRKRHASNTGGVEPCPGVNQLNGMVTKKKKVTLQNDSKLLETISDSTDAVLGDRVNDEREKISSDKSGNKKGAFHVGKVGDEKGSLHVEKVGIEKFRTVLSQRSVYYRSQVQDTDQEESR